MKGSNEPMFNQERFFILISLYEWKHWFNKLNTKPQEWMCLEGGLVGQIDRKDLMGNILSKQWLILYSKVLKL